MPGKSVKQKQLMAIALIAPGRIKAKGKADLKDLGKDAEKKPAEGRRALSTSEYIRRRNREKYG